jgi:hypothetical protein
LQDVDNRLYGFNNIRRRRSTSNESSLCDYDQRYPSPIKLRQDSKSTTQYRQAKVMRTCTIVGQAKHVSNKVQEEDIYCSCYEDI